VSGRIRKKKSRMNIENHDLDQIEMEPGKARDQKERGGLQAKEKVTAFDGS